VCGDERGMVWAWDLVDVRSRPPQVTLRMHLNTLLSQATLFQPNPPPKVHNKCITWTEQNPVEAGEIITASADGDVKVWRYPSLESGT
jgi:mitogen-activated protein kinase organizer 1